MDTVQTIDFNRTIFPQNQFRNQLDIFLLRVCFLYFYSGRRIMSMIISSFREIKPLFHNNDRLSLHYSDNNILNNKQFS